MSDPAEFVLARIAEREEAARSEWDWMIERHGPDFWTLGEGAPTDQEWQYNVDRDGSLRVSPRYVLARCAADRQIVEAATSTIGLYGSGTVLDLAWETLRLLALPDADHPDYREEWKP